MLPSCNNNMHSLFISFTACKMERMFNWVWAVWCLCERGNERDTIWEKLHIVAFDFDWQLAMHVVAVLAWSNMGCVYANTQFCTLILVYLPTYKRSCSNGSVVWYTCKYMHIYNCSLVNNVLTNLIFTRLCSMLNAIRTVILYNYFIYFKIFALLWWQCRVSCWPQTFEQYYIYLIINIIVIHKIKRKSRHFS